MLRLEKPGTRNNHARPARRRRRAHAPGRRRPVWEGGRCDL